MFEDATTSKMDAVAEVLGDCARSIEQLGPVRWSFVPSNGAGLRVEARIDGGWLLLRAPLGKQRWSVSAADVWRLLQQNGALPGGVKLARLPGESGFWACAEVPLDSDLDLGLRIPQACAGFEVAAVCGSPLASLQPQGCG